MSIPLSDTSTRSCKLREKRAFVGLADKYRFALHLGYYYNLRCNLPERASLGSLIFIFLLRHIEKRKSDRYIPWHPKGTSYGKAEIKAEAKNGIALVVSYELQMAIPNIGIL